MANYFINNDEKQKTPTGTVTPTVQPNGKTEAPADAKKITTPVGGDAVNTPVQQQAVVPASSNAVGNAQQGAPQPTPEQVQPQNYFAPNTATKDVTQGEQQEQSGEDEGLSDDEKASIAMNDAILNNYRKQYKQASDVTQGVFDYLNGGAQKEEEPYKKKNESKKKLYALADAIRQIGNLAYVTKGATPQKFNNPVAEQEAKYQQEKALRDKDRAARADAAQKKAKMDADAAYKDALLAMKNNEFNRNVFNDYREAKENADKFAWNKQKDQANLDLRGRALDDAREYHNKQLAQGERRLQLSAQRNAIEAAKGGSSGGKSASLTNLSSPSGHLNRKKDLNSIEKKQITQYLINNGFINKANMDMWKRYNMLGDSKSANDLQNYWIAYAANMAGKKGDAFRKVLKDHYMYGETTTVSAPKKPVTPKKPASKPQQSKSASKPQQQKPASKPAAKKPAARQNGGQNKSGVGKSHNGYKHTKALGL